MAEYKILVGDTINKSIVFAEITVDDNSDKHFSVCFSEVEPFIATYEFLKERAEGYVESMDVDSLKRTLQWHDCKIDQLADELVAGDIEELIDISLYPNWFTIEGIEDSIYFESVAVGQHDTRDILVPIDKEFSDWIHTMWDAYHLQKLPELLKIGTRQKIEEYVAKIGDEEELIKEWLRKIYQE